MRPFHLEIVTPDGLIFDGEAESLLVHTEDGDVQILRGHADYFASVAIGRAKVTAAGGVSRVASCAGGFLSVEKGNVRLVAITFEYADEIDINRAKAAAERAEQCLEKASDEKAERLAKAKLSRALNRIHVSEMDHDRKGSL